MSRAVPFSWPKSAGFTFFPPGVVRQYDAGKWALYHDPVLMASYIVIDFGDTWKINHYAGRLQVKFAQDVIASKPCCNDL